MAFDIPEQRLIRETEEEGITLRSVKEAETVFDTSFKSNGWEETLADKMAAPVTDYARAAEEKAVRRKWGKISEKELRKHCNARENSGGIFSGTWFLRTTESRFGYVHMISPDGSMFQFSPNPDFPQYIRPVVRLDLTAAPFTGTVLPAAKSCPDPMMMSELFIGYPAEDCRTLKMNHEGHRHDNFNTFHVLWKPFIEDGDGKRYRVAASFSEAYDFPEKFQLFLIPESYDLTGPCMEHDIENHWLCPNWMMDGQYGQGRTVEIVVNPEEGTVLWRKDRKLYRWESPFVHFSEEQLMDDLPEDFTLKALDEKKQCRIRPDDVCLTSATAGT